MSTGIVSYGAYIPKYRIQREDIAKAWGGRARGESSVAQHNEDAITMAAEAAHNSLEQSGVDPAQIDALYLATSSSPYVEHSLTRAVADTLRMKQDADLADFGGSPRAGAVALKACLDAVQAGRIRYGLVALSDSRPISPGSDAELSFGSGAAAFLLGSKGVIAEIEASYTSSAYIIDSWREAGANFVHSHEPRFTREYGYVEQIVKAARGLLEKIERNIQEFSSAVLSYHPDERVMRGIAKTLEISPAQVAKGSLGGSVGDLGVASVPLGLAAVLDQAKPGDKVLALFYGSGIGDALSLTVKEGIATRRPEGHLVEAYLNRKEYVDYLTFARMRGLVEKAETPARMWVSPLSPSLWRDGATLRRLEGARCRKCGYVNFPVTLRKICIHCGSIDLETVWRSRKGKIHTFCVNLYNPPGMESPLPIIIADMEDSTRYKALGTEMKVGQIKIGMAVELIWRKIGSEEGAIVYNYVFRPSF